MYDTETLSIDGVSNEEIFTKNDAENMQQKLVPDLYNFGFDPKQPLHARNSFKSKIF